MALDPAFEVQLQIRQNAQEMQDAFADLHKWCGEISRKVCGNACVADFRGVLQLEKAHQIVILRFFHYPHRGFIGMSQVYPYD